MIRAVRTSDLLGRKRVVSSTTGPRPPRRANGPFRHGFGAELPIQPPGYHESHDRVDARGTTEARGALVLRAPGAGAPRGPVPVPAQAAGAAGRGRRVPAQVRRAAPQVQVPVLDLHLGRVLRLVRRLVVRHRPDRAAVRARDGTRARGEAAGAAGERTAVHPVPRRDDHDARDAAGRLERGEGRDRGAAPRLARRGGDLGRGRCDRLEPPEGARLPRLLPQPVQPAADRAARRRPGRGGAPSRALGGRLPRTARCWSRSRRTRS